MSIQGSLSAESLGSTERVKLSIVVPCYNEERTLEACVDAVLAIQSATLEIELIVVDDCSKDKSLEVARNLQQRVPGMILLHHESTRGKGPLCEPASPPPPEISLRSRMPIASTTPGIWSGCWRRCASAKRMSCWAPASCPWVTTGALLLALRRQSVPDDSIEHAHRPEPHRHGDLLQGFFAAR